MTLRGRADAANAVVVWTTAEDRMVGRSGMASKVFRRRAVVAALVVAALAAGKTASAQGSQDACITQLGNCYYWAATQSSFWSMWASGVDCEFQMVECMRLAIIGR